MFVRQDVPIDGAGAPIAVEVICGFAQHLDFDSQLFDAEGNNPQPVHRGSNLNSSPPPFAINVAPSQLLNRFLLITATVQSLGGNNLSVDAVFRQGDRQVGLIHAEGTFDDVKTVSLVGRFVS